MQQVIPQMVGMMKLQYPSIPTEIWDELQKEIELSMSNEFFQMLVPIYQKYLTQDDLEAIITFYKSPAGSKMASVAPQISGEAMQTGQLLGMQIGMKVYDKLKDKGLID